MWWAATAGNAHEGMASAVTADPSLILAEHLLLQHCFSLGAPARKVCQRLGSRHQCPIGAQRVDDSCQDDADENAHDPSSKDTRDGACHHIPSRAQYMRESILKEKDYIDNKSMRVNDLVESSP